MDEKSRLTNISQNLGESDEFLKWRISMFEHAEKLPKEKFSYGLGITSVISRIETFRVSESYTYQWDTENHGVRIMRWAEAMKAADFSEKISSLFKSQKETMPSNHFFALSAALFSDGLVVAIDEGVSADIFLETVVPKSGADILIVFAGAHSKITIHEKFSFLSCGAGEMNGRTVVVVLEEESKVMYAENASYISGGLFFINKKAFAKDGARISFVEAFKHENGFLKSETFVSLGGKKSKANIVTLMQTNAAAACDSFVSVFHNAPETTSDIFAVGTADGLSKIIYRALINVPKGIHAAVGRQAGSFLMLSTRAEIDAIPSLEIASEDTKASHALSVRRLSKENLFYPRTRGFPSRDAEELVIRGLMDNALAATVAEHEKQFSSDSFFS